LLFELIQSRVGDACFHGDAETCQSKAMTLVAAAGRVDSVTITGDGKDRVIVVGEGVDSINLTSNLCKMWAAPRHATHGGRRGQEEG
jgi:hypothetical protein